MPTILPSYSQAVGNSSAISSANSGWAISGAAFNSAANSTTAIPTCSGTGISGVVRSDGHFCLGVSGSVVSG